MRRIKSSSNYHKYDLCSNLCNFVPVDQCHKNATHYWPLDKTIGDRVLDVQGVSNGKGVNISTKSSILVSGPRWHSVRTAAINLFETG